MHVAIKICGLSTAEAVTAALTAGADYLGFIFFPKSPRNVEIQQASELMRLANGQAQTVAVTVDAELQFLDRLVEIARPDWLQFHGNESAEYLVRIKQRYGLSVIKSISVRSAEDLVGIDHYAVIADRLLLDAKAPEGADLPGGNGIPFDWRLLETFQAQSPYFLSGGLDSGNVEMALDMTGASAIDVSSGVESSPGLKDIAKIAGFIKTVRDYEKARSIKDVPA